MSRFNERCEYRLRRKPLATCLGAVLLASACAPAIAIAARDTAWLGLRADPARRIFAQLALPHAKPDVAHALATVWPVSNCADAGTGSLRDAVNNAEDGDSIDLTALTCAKITLETGSIHVPIDNLTLKGPGRDALAIDGNQLDRVLFHNAVGILSVRGMTIQGGRDRATGFHVAGGGCIASAGYLVLDDATVKNCYAGGEGSYGGAIYAYSLTMMNSTLSGNRAYGVHEDAGTAAFGGAAFVYTMDLDNSTVSGNRAEHLFNPARSTYDIGGGIITVVGGTIANSTIDSNFSYGRGGGVAAFNPIAVSNSTFSANVAQTDVGGALFLRWPSVVIVGNSTITANHARAGGGLWLATSGSTLESTIIFGNSADAGFADIEGRQALAIDGSHNMIGIADPAVALPGDTRHADPLLGALRDNGGPSRTHALLAGSPAVDSGSNPAQLVFDQRGTPFPRTYGSATDIGAYEQQALPPPVVQTPVPALSTWTVALLAALFGLLGIGSKPGRRRTRQHAAKRCSASTR